MQSNSLDAMQAALRVLTGFTEGRPPDPADIEELRRLAPADVSVELPPDELACEVIQVVIRARPEARGE